MVFVMVIRGELADSLWRERSGEPSGAEQFLNWK